MEEAVPRGLIFSVAVDVLAEKGDLLVALVDEHFALIDDRFGRAGDLLSPGIGDDAIGAEFVAAPDDRDVGFDFVVSFGDEVVEVLFKSVVGLVNLFFSVKNLVDNGAQVGNIIGADYEVEVGEFPEEGVPLGHRHAAGNADDGVLFAAAADLSELAHDLSLGQVADRAGVKDQKISRFLIGSGGQISFLQLAGHDIGVQFVHLAAVSSDKVSLWFVHTVDFLKGLLG